MCDSCNTISVYAKAIHIDPTRTTTLRNAFVRDYTRRFKSLKRAIRQKVYTEDFFGLRKHIALHAGDYTFTQSQAKVPEFLNWLKAKINETFEISTLEMPQLGNALNPGWQNVYLRDSYKRGIMRARTEMNKAGYEVPTIAESGGIDIVFGQPFHLDRIGAIYTRAYGELKNITSSMEGIISSTLAQGMADGDGALTLARKINYLISGTGESFGLRDKMGRWVSPERRARIMARTEMIRAHHLATVQEYKNWGAVGIKVQAEWKTGGDNRVCSICAGMEGEVFTLEQVEKMIPAHPQCRCIALPFRKKMDTLDKMKEQNDTFGSLDGVAKRLTKPEYQEKYMQYKQEATEWWDGRPSGFKNLWKQHTRKIGNNDFAGVSTTDENIIRKAFMKQFTDEEWDFIETWQSSWSTTTKDIDAQQWKYIARQVEKGLPEMVYASDTRWTLEEFMDLVNTDFDMKVNTYLKWRAYTQKIMSAIYQNKMTLYRGIQGKTGASLVEDVWNGMMGRLQRTKFTIKDMPLIGYTSAEGVAQDFATIGSGEIGKLGNDMVRKATFYIRQEIAIEDIIASPDLFAFLTNGVRSEVEWILRGSVRSVDINDVFVDIQFKNKKQFMSAFNEKYLSKIR